MEGVVAGVGGYGNCIGIPTVGGQTIFSRHYANNPLVNVFCLGVAPKEGVFYGRAAGIGNPVVYVGAKTGRDGIHGATMASEEFDDESQEKRPTVQVGDPFMEKLLLEACLEVMRAGYVVGIQDMGAAGLTCSTCEMSSRADTGIEIELDLVPQREEGMTPYEIMLSESQERMLLVTEPANLEKLREIFRRWGLDAVSIGKVTDDGILRIRRGGEIVAELPSKPLADGAPIYDRPMRRPAYLDRVHSFDEDPPPPSDWRKTLSRLIGSPSLCRKRWIWEQYDHMVRTNTVMLPGGDAAVLRLKGSPQLLAMSTDCNPRLCYLDPKAGAEAAVAEACRNITCVGGQPLAATNCLNFASPENPEVMWQFSQTVDGIRDACEVFGTPITGGNVSFYNETNGVGIFPTPVIGMVGLLESEERLTTAALKQAGDVLLLLGPSEVRLAGSEYLEILHGRVEGPAAPLDLGMEKKVQELLLHAIGRGWVRSAHDCSEGGLLMAALESSFLADQSLGFELECNREWEAHRALFGEGPSRILVTLKPEDEQDVRAAAAERGVDCTSCGRVTFGTIRVVYNGEMIFHDERTALFEEWDGALERWVRGAKEGVVLQ
jgi:phosphoribosylformylglycinamidine synthase